jgi:tetratricopeptide (TPR) repeat protein
MSRIQSAALGAAFLTLALQAGMARADAYDDASRLFKQGNQSAALEKIEIAIKANPRDARARFLKGLILTEQNKPNEAIAVFTALTTDYPELPEPYNNLAVLYAAKGEYDKARSSLEMAIRTHPSYAVAHENLGDVYAKMASQAYDKALQLDRANAAAQTKLALIKELFSSTVVPGKGVAPPAVAPAATAPAAVADTRPAPSEKIAPAAPAKAETEAVLAAVNGWANAWSERDASAYLSYYAADFEVPGGDPRASWEAARRERITRPKSIKVTVGSPKVTFDANGRALVNFRQRYQSDTLDTSGSKTLTLTNNNGRWLIVQERMK